MIIIHGDFVEKSYPALDKYLPGASQLHYADTTPTQIRQFISNTDLFGHQPWIVIHGLLSAQKSQKKTAIIDLILDHPQSKVVLYEIKKIPVREIPKGNGVLVQEYQPHNHLFSFLDSVYPGNYIQSKSLLDKTLKHHEIDMVFYMLLRHIKKLVIYIDNPNKQKMAPFIAKKLGAQSRQFGLSTAVTFWNTLIDIDIHRKQGRLSTSFDESINLALLELSFH
jgi:hypothetical protein